MSKRARRRYSPEGIFWNRCRSARSVRSRGSIRRCFTSGRRRSLRTRLLPWRGSAAPGVPTGKRQALEAMESKLKRKDEVLAIVVGEMVRLKKELGEN